MRFTFHPRLCYRQRFPRKHVLRITRTQTLPPHPRTYLYRTGRAHHRLLVLNRGRGPGCFATLCLGMLRCIHWAGPVCRDGHLSTADPAYSVGMCKSRRTPRYVKKSNGLFLPTKVFFSPRSQAFFNPMAKNWSLESLAIGPISHATDFAFWRDAFHFRPSLV